MPSEADQQRTHKRAVRQAFDQAASGYDAAAALQREVSALLADFVMAHPAAKPVHRALDGGCGTGHGQAALARLWPQAERIALDFAPAMLSLLPKESALPVCGDLDDLPLAGASLDAVWSSLALQWCSPTTSLREIFRVLSPGGRAWIATLGPDTLWELREAFAAIDRDRHAILFHPQAHWLDAATQAGLKAIAHHSTVVQAKAPDLKHLLRDIKQIGAHQVGSGRRRALLGREAWARLEAAYEQHRLPDGSLPASYDLILLCLEKPA